MVNRKLLFSVFNTVLKSYSSKLVYVNTRRNYVHICTNKHLLNSSKNVINYTTTASNGIVSFEDVKNVTNNKSVLIIDVREPDELKETGQIPGSINIPLGDVERVFQSTTNEEFVKQYGINKPDSNTFIICSCLLGKRSASAQNILQQLGYEKVHNYLGGWQEWSEKSK